MSNHTFNPKFVDSDPVTVINILNNNGAIDYEDLDIARITFDNHSNPKYEVLEYNEEFVKSIISQLSDHIKQLPGRFIIVINNNDVMEDLTDGHFHRAIENLMEILWPLYMTYKWDTLIDQDILDGIYTCILYIVQATIPDNSKYSKQLANSIRIHIDHNYNSQNSSTGVIYKGKWYKSLRSLCREKGLNYNTIYRRWKRGRTIEEAIDSGDNRCGKSGKEVIYKGKKYRSLKSLCEEKGLNYNTILSRLNQYGETIEEAIDFDNHRKAQRKEVIYKGKKYRSLKSLCEEKGISRWSLYRRLKRGKTIEEAIDSDDNGCGKEVIYKGKKYRSVTSLCEEKGIPRISLYSRLKRGETIEEAIDFYNHRKAQRKDRK